MGLFLIFAFVLIAVLAWFSFWVNDLMVEKGYGSGFGWIVFFIPFMGIVFLLMPYRK